MKKTFFLVSVLLTILIFYPLLVRPGYIFTLDWSPLFDLINSPFESFTGANGIGVLRFLFESYLTLALLDRFVLIGTFIGILWGGYVLLHRTDNVYSKLFGAVFLGVNPFIYGRVMDGQINVFIASMLLIWFLYFLIDFFEKQTWGKSFLLIFWTFLLAMTSIYSLYIAFFCYGVFLVVYCIFSPQRLALCQKSLIVGAGAILINSFWLLPQLMPSKESTPFVQSVEAMDTAFSTAFSVHPGQHGVLLNTALLRGYWGESQKRFLTLDEWFQYPGIGVALMMIVWILVILGIRYQWQKNTQRQLVISLCLIGGLGYVLTLGIHPDSPWRGAVQYLYQYMPFYEGFREPQKWLILLILFYAYFGSYGVQYLSHLVEKRSLQTGVMIFCTLVPILVTPVMLFGFVGQLRPREFPASWQMIASKMRAIKPTEKCANQEKGRQCYTFLYLPWHGYIGLGWVGRTTSSYRLATFLTPEPYNLVGDNDQIGVIFSTSQRPESRIIERYVFRRGQRVNLLSQLQEMYLFHTDIKKLGIQYIILFQDAKYASDYRPFLDAMVSEKYLSIYQDTTLIKVYTVL